jgi:hypothetical protein
MSKMKSLLADIDTALDEILVNLYIEEAMKDKEEKERSEAVFNSMVREFLK